MIETTSVITTTVTVEISDDQIEDLVERHLQRKLGLPKGAEVSLEWRGTHCPYLHITIKHQRPALTSTANPDHADWSCRLGDLFDT